MPWDTLAPEEIKPEVFKDWAEVTLQEVKQWGERAGEGSGREGGAQRRKLTRAKTRRLSPQPRLHWLPSPERTEQQEEIIRCERVLTEPHKLSQTSLPTLFEAG